MSSDTIRPTKKQREILTYIEGFITEHGYSPSYREIMNGLDYTSVATVSLHVNSLIRRGHLRKRDHSARSLEVVAPSSGSDETAKPSSLQPHEETWLVQKVEDMFNRFEQAGEAAGHAYDEMAVMVNALRVLGLEAAASAFMPRLAELRHKTTADTMTLPQEEA
jgi:SOS-response transcriptional repressor LexA